MNYSPRIIGLDGEGIGRNPHKYILLAAASDDGFIKSIEDLNGLSSEACLSFLADLAYNNPGLEVFSYAFGYDITKMLKDLPDSLLYRLVRPDERRQIYSVKDGTMPAEEIWKDFRLNWISSRFTVRRGKRNGKRSKERGMIIWDVFKFFQSSFVNSLNTWKVTDEQTVAEIERMKKLRSEFRSDDLEEIKGYCISECKNLAILVRKLKDAHEAAGLKLKSYYGAGSTATAVFANLGTKKLVKNEMPWSKESIPAVGNMRSGVMRAFFGGRFENSVIGPIHETIYNYDISSAYPYQTVQLPCLVHGEWKLIADRSELDKYSHALVFYNLFAANNQVWGPLPYRHADGTIIYPVTGGTGFCYLKEFKMAEKMGAQFIAAWVLEQDCECIPFEGLPPLYNERQKLGKDGPGIVLKLGINAIYGKIAQSIGTALFNSWVWAGMITSGCRAQLLEALLLHEDPSNLLAVATDGIYTLERLTLPTPIETGTGSMGKPLGGWEEKIIEGGMFFARPGVNFSLDNSTDVKLARGRGYGRSVITTHAEAIQRSFANGETAHIFPNVQRFHSIKSSISRSYNTEMKCNTYNRADRFGEWTEESMKLSFSAGPKRREIEGNRLLPWKLSGGLSSEYYKGISEDEYEKDEITGDP